MKLQVQNFVQSQRIDLIGLVQWFSARDDSGFLGDISCVQRHVRLSQPGRVCPPVVLWVEAGDAAAHLMIHRIAGVTKSDLPPKSKVPRLRPHCACLQGSNGYADTENRFVDSVGEGESGTRESSLETYTLPCVKLDSQWEFALQCWELKSVLCDNLEGWDGIGGKREVQDRGGEKEKKLIKRSSTMV